MSFLEGSLPTFINKIMAINIVFIIMNIKGVIKIQADKLPLGNRYQPMPVLLMFNI